MNGKITLESVFSAAIIALLWAIIISIGIVLWRFLLPEVTWPWVVLAVLWWGFCVIISIVSLLIKGKKKPVSESRRDLNDETEPAPFGPEEEES